MSTTHLLYLHGFRSSPLSTKSIRMATVVRQRYPDVHWWCPQLPASPRQAMRKIFKEIATWRTRNGYGGMAVMGSSLGGFYATCVAEAMVCKAVLLNPAVEPARDLAKHIGQQTTWQNPSERFFFRPRYIDELTLLRPTGLAQPHNYLTVIAKGDEVLDWREMAARYANTQQRLIEGGDHALSQFEPHIPAILDFLDLAAPVHRSDGLFTLASHH